MSVAIKRVYDAADEADGYRVLVDRLWPRGVSKDKAKLDEWLKEVGPSNELRMWYGHDPAKFPEFKKRYSIELSSNPAFAQLRQLIHEHTVVTLVYSAHDGEHSQAAVLQELLA